MPLALIVSAHRAPHVPPNRTLDPGLDDDRLAERLVAIGGIPPLLRHRRTFMASLIPLVRDDLRVCSGTVALQESDAVGVPMYIFAGLDDIVAPPAHVAAWADHAGAGAQTYALPGGHLFIQSHAEQFLAALAAVLRRHETAPAGSRQ
jgi:surfactin synthase thioesterase subunit